MAVFHASKLETAPVLPKLPLPMAVPLAVLAVPLAALVLTASALFDTPAAVLNGVGVSAKSVPMQVRIQS
jgi:uncharacterized membrane protein